MMCFMVGLLKFESYVYTYLFKCVHELRAMVILYFLCVRRRSCKEGEFERKTNGEAVEEANATRNMRQKKI